MLKRSLLWIASFALLPVHLTFAQFSLVSHTPSHGAVGVSTTAAIELIFNEPVDTSAEFEISDGFFLATEIYPDPGQPTSTTFPNDRTVRLEFELSADTQYWMVLWSALSTSGASLDGPVAFTFSTGSSLPSGSVSGTVTSPDLPVQGTVVALFRPESILDDDDTGAGGFAVVDGTGAYNVEHVAEGEYLVVAILENEFDDDPSGEGEGLSAYDANDDRAADPVAVAAGEAVSGIDMVLRTPVPLTARELFPDVQGLAVSVLPGSELMTAVGFEVEADGRAAIWAYLYSTDEAGTVVYTIGGFLFSLPNEADTESMPLTGEWMDSDAALSISEEAGGADFRLKSENVFVFAMLARAEDFADVGFKRGRETAPILDRQSISPAELPIGIRKAVSRALAEVRTGWIVQYLSESGFLVVIIDAETGEVISTMGLAHSAAAAVAVAQDAAASWSADARLVVVADAGFDGISQGGLSDTWMYVYYDAVLDQARAFYVSGGSIADEEEYALDDLPSTTPLPDVWVDSEAAAAVAEAASGDFRVTYTDSYVTAMLSRGLREHGLSRAVWTFSYLDFESGAELTIDVDAETGLVITASEAPGESALSLRLHPGYPNPFSVSTMVAFEMSTAGPVHVAVYDALGREVALLADRVLEAGTHAIGWQPIAMPSGLYVCRVQAGGAQRAILLTLMR